MRIEEAQAAPAPVAMVQPPGRRQVGQHGGSSSASRFGLSGLEQAVPGAQADDAALARLHDHTRNRTRSSWNHLLVRPPLQNLHTTTKQSRQARRPILLKGQSLLKRVRPGPADELEVKRARCAPSGPVVSCQPPGVSRWSFDGESSGTVVHRAACLLKLDLGLVQVDRSKRKPFARFLRNGCRHCCRGRLLSVLTNVQSIDGL